MENMTLTIEQIKNADWEIHDNVTDHNYGDGYAVYKAYVATIDGHEVTFEYSDCYGYRMLIDNKWVREEDALGDCGRNPVEIIENMLDDVLDDLDEIRTRYMYESGECVESFTQTDSRDNDVFVIEVHSYERPDRGTVYIAYKDEEPNDRDVEPEYIEDYDYESVLEYHKNHIREYVEEHAYDMIEELKEKKKFVGTDEKVDDIIDEEVESEIREYVGAYSLEYYYVDSEDYYRRIETHALYMEGSDMDEKIEALFVEKDEDEDEE